MGLYAIGEGMLYWKCQSPVQAKKPCPTHNVHVSDEAVRWISPTEVALPVCGRCGATKTLKVIFHDDEQLADNLIQYGMVPTKVKVNHPITGTQFEAEVPAYQPVGANPAYVMHQELARLLIAAGKLPPSEEGAS